MNSPSLTFQMDLPDSPVSQLVHGKLILTTPSNGNVSYSATSGIPGYQYYKSWRMKARGCLPPSSQVGPYSVSTQRLWMPHVRGVEGSFYAIAPFSVTCEGVCRGDFGVHFDANVPGSAGCVVVRLQDHWDDLRERLADFAAARVKAVPLSVVYS